jgi:putative tricarboxylic transport membrane protein
VEEEKMSGKKAIKNKAFFSGCCLLVFSACIYCLIARFPDTAAEYRTISPSFFPYVLATILAVLSFLLMIEGWHAPAGPILSIRFDNKNTYRTGALLLILVAFSSLLTTLGFIIDAFLFMFSIQLILGERRFIVLAVVSLAVSLGMYFVFATLFKVPLPMGIWLE